jgi:hypothetical protein
MGFGKISILAGGHGKWYNMKGEIFGQYLLILHMNLTFDISISFPGIS